MKIQRLLLLLVIALFIANCVKEINFNADSADPALVVSGSFTNIKQRHRVYLSHPNDYNKRIFQHIAGASLLLSDDLGNTWPLVERRDTNLRQYWYETDTIQGIAGRKYTLDILLPDGKRYRSTTQTLPEAVPLDNVELKGEDLQYVNAQGILVREKNAVSYINSTVPADTKNKFLRWEGEMVYIFNEIAKIYDPFGVQKQCFIRQRISDQEIPLARLEDFQPGAAIRRYVGRRRIDNAFEHRVCFTSTQYTIDREAYQYWSKISAISAPSGTVFDALPAKVRSNVGSLDNPEELVLGYFEVAGAALERRYLLNGQLGPDYLVPNNPYCNYDWGRWPPVNHPECHDCLVLDGATTLIPEWWQ